VSTSAYDEAIGRMVQRVDWTDANVPVGRFPNDADPVSGEWATTPNADWTGGFWVGELWLAGLYTGDSRYWDRAAEWAARLEPRAASQTIFRGFLFYYGAAAGSVLGGDPSMRELALAGVDGLARDFIPTAGLIPLGEDAEEAHAVGPDKTNIDGVSTSALLLWAHSETGDGELRDKAVEHALSHAPLCVRDDGSVCQSAAFDTRTGSLVERYTHKGYSDRSTWARAQAWGMLGYSLTGCWAPDEPELVRLAEHVSDWWLDHVPADRVAYWDFDAPADENPERDTSATAIAAASLLKLSELTRDPARAERYRRFATETVDALLPYLKRASGGNEAGGILTEGCYNHRVGLAPRNELIWGSYFLFESLGVLTGKLDVSRI
jgi:unsaturated chondroitin disaccharide hydrolase